MDKTPNETETLKSDIKRKDYLTEMRSAGLLRSEGDSVQKLIKDQSLNPKERAVLLKAETEKLEEKMKWIQKKRKFVKEKSENDEKHISDDMKDDDEHLDDLYIQSIKAKLKILKDQN